MNKKQTGFNLAYVLITVIGIHPRMCYDACAVTRTNLVFVGIDQRIKRRPVH